MKNLKERFPEQTKGTEIVTNSKTTITVLFYFFSIRVDIFFGALPRPSSTHLFPRHVANPGDTPAEYAALLTRDHYNRHLY